MSTWTAAGRLARTCWEGAGRAVDSLLFPATCSICDIEIEGPLVCSDCRSELLGAMGPACVRCAMPIGPHADQTGGCWECRGQALGFDRALALGPYQGPIRNLCLRLKHERDAWMGRWLAELVAEAQWEPLRAEVAAGAWVVPVPLHWRKRLRRGYNQAEELALGLGRALGAPVRPILRRPVATPPLAMIGRTERAKIMRGAFRARSRPGLGGRTIVLVDDILTSGSTAGAAARALKQAGAGRVVVVVLGRAEGKP